MYFFLAITQLLKTFNPYFRKHILQTLESHEYLFIYTIFVGFFVFLFFLYKTIFHEKSFDQLIDKVQNLSFLQFIYFAIIAFVTISSSIVLITMDKYYNTPLINGLLTKVIAAILLMCVGIFLFEEKYNYQQIFGIFLTIAGLYLVMSNNKKK
jgi:drug/metabolite transporter (DMT)-like permease